LRPAKLTMQAFGPYRGVEVVDFEELGLNRVFLIHGETGAGKTTILDAIVFALYGDTSGGERSGQQMRAESAPAELGTEVVYEFSLGARRFRVSRSPRQELTKKRGEGVTLHQPQATFVELTADGERVVATGVSKVNTEVKELLGFSSEQFRQVVVLPQGKFRDLLSARSDDREEILKQLFRTDVFAHVERRLADRAREVNAAAATVKAQRAAQLGLVDAADDAELAALTAVAKAAEESAAADAEEAESANRAVALRLAAALEADNAAVALRDALAARQSLEGRTGWAVQTQARLDAATRAAAVEPALARVRDAQAARTAALHSARDAMTSLETATVAESSATAELAEQTALAPRREEARDAVRSLDALRGPVAKLAIAVDAEVAAAAALEVAEAAVSERADELGTARAAFDTAGARAATTRDALARMEGLREKSVTAARLSDSCTRLAGVREQLARARARETEAEAALATAEAAATREEESLGHTESRWRAGRGAALAATLADGAPCPVCGSPDHPNPAVPEPGAPTDAELEAAQAAAKAAREAAAAARTALADSAAAVGAAAASEATLVEQLGVGAETDEGAARLAAATCEQDVERLESAIAAGGSPDELIADAREMVSLAERAKDEAEAHRAAVSATFVQARTTAAELGERVPAEVRDPDALEAAGKAARSKADALDASLELATTACAAAREATAAAKAAAAVAGVQEAKDRAALGSALALAAAALAEAGFADTEGVTAATLAPAVLVATAAELQEYRQALAEATGAVAAAERACLRLESARTDTAAIQAEASAAQARLKVEQERRSDALSRANTFARVRAELDAIDTRSAAIDAEYRVVGRLAEVANGQLSGAKVSFQRWVLGSYLDTVLEAATRRLYSMSKGRYRLVREKSVADGRRASGLDLAVFDEFSGTDRPAVTLSGGESFLAALALALGLAETVQEFAGGTRLETIFVDEGFGALDPDSLDKAMDALVELQDSGRLVGVISHVPELRQRIQARLEVSAGPAGSSTRFIVP
jgi:exonuclease SbcC